MEEQKPGWRANAALRIAAAATTLFSLFPAAAPAASASDAHSQSGGTSTSQIAHPHSSPTHDTPPPSVPKETIALSVNLDGTASLQGFETQTITAPNAAAQAREAKLEATGRAS